MYDPFPFKPSPGLVYITTKLSYYLNFVTLSLHVHEVLLAFTFYHIICTYISPAISRKAFPNHYPQLNCRTQVNWDVHVTSFVQSTMISALALWVILVDKERSDMDWRERVWGYTGGSGFIEGLGAGYFLWDLWISFLHVDIFGFGLLAHAVCALWVFGLGFRPFVNFYAPVFILYELSSPFLNIHWFCDKIDMTGSSLQLYNGVVLMTTFFLSRLVWGVWQTFQVFYDIYRAIEYQKTTDGRAWLDLHAQLSSTSASGLIGGPAAEVMRYAEGKHVPFWLGATYLGSNLVLTGLNFYWFGKMIETIRGRFPPPFGTKRKVKITEEPVIGRGVDADDVKSVQIEATTVLTDADLKKRKNKK